MLAPVSYTPHDSLVANPFRFRKMQIDVVGILVQKWYTKEKRKNVSVAISTS